MSECEVRRELEEEIRRRYGDKACLQCLDGVDSLASRMLRYRLASLTDDPEAIRRAECRMSIVSLRSFLGIDDPREQVLKDLERILRRPAEEIEEALNL